MGTLIRSGVESLVHTHPFVISFTPDTRLSCTKRAAWLVFFSRAAHFGDLSYSGVQEPHRITTGGQQASMALIWSIEVCPRIPNQRSRSLMSSDYSAVISTEEFSGVQEPHRITTGGQQASMALIWSIEVCPRIPNQRSRSLLSTSTTFTACGVVQ